MAEHKPITSYSLIDEDIPSDASGATATRDERRRAPRTPLEADVTILFDGQELQGMTHNISRTGIFVSTYRVLPLGAGVQLKFNLPSGSSSNGVIAKGVVCRVRKSSDGVTAGMGIAFGELDELDRGLIHGYCAEEHVPRTSDIRISRPRPR